MAEIIHTSPIPYTECNTLHDIIHVHTNMLSNISIGT